MSLQLIHLPLLADLISHLTLSDFPHFIPKPIKDCWAQTLENSLVANPRLLGKFDCFRAPQCLRMTFMGRRIKQISFFIWNQYSNPSKSCLHFMHSEYRILIGTSLKSQKLFVLLWHQRDSCLFSGFVRFQYQYVLKLETRANQISLTFFVVISELI